MAEDAREPQATEAVVVLRCADCGDTFPLHEGDERRCPSCGGTHVEIATEPLL